MANVFNATWAVGSRNEGPVGFWEPHTATIDFCESNYVYSPYVCEMWNSVTGFWIVYVAILGLRKGTPVEFLQRYPRYVIGWLIIAMVGGGTVLLHGTLIRSFQAFDEVPMMLANFVFLYAFHHTECNWLAVAAYAVACCVVVIIYFVFEMYIVFFALYTSVVAYFWVRQLAHIFGHFTPIFADPGDKLEKCWDAYLMAIRRAAIYYGGSVILWVWENVDCANVESYHFHVAWHFGAAVGTYWFIVSLIMLHLTRKRENFTLSFGGPMRLFGIVKVHTDKNL